MKILIIFLLYLNIFANDKIEFKSSYGFLSEGSLLATFKDARVALKSWVESLASDLNGQVDVTFYKKEEVLYKDLAENRLDMIVIGVPFYFEHRENIAEHAHKFWSLNIGGKNFNQYYLIARKSINAKGFEDIKNRTVSLGKNDQTSKVWLDKKSYKINKTESKKFAKKLMYKDKESSVILNVFFNKSDFAVVKSNIWNTMLQLNPSISKKVEIIEKTEEIHPTFLGMFSKKSDEKNIKAFFEISSKMEELDKFKKISNLLDFNEVYEININDLSKLKSFYKEYYTLKAKYK